VAKLKGVRLVDVQRRYLSNIDVLQLLTKLRQTGDLSCPNEERWDETKNCTNCPYFSETDGREYGLQDDGTVVTYENESAFDFCWIQWIFREKSRPKHD
jgi:hypothetical protein